MEVNTYQVDNYVHIAPAGALEVCSIVGIEGERATVSSINDPFNNYELPIAELNPIPLTEFLLKELGFNEVNDEGGNTAHAEELLVKDKVAVRRSSGDNSFHVCDDNLQDAEQVQYVHELQNYYKTKTDNSLKLP